MKITIWGARGSIPVSFVDCQKYGGNTTCFEISCNSFNEHLIIDAGTGIYNLGATLPEEGKANIFFSHVHLDHIQGLPFFAPLYKESWQIKLYVPKGAKDFLNNLMDGRFFPVRAKGLPCKLEIEELNEHAVFNFGQIKIETSLVPHTCICHAFRLLTNNIVVCIAPDIEIDDLLSKEVAKKIMQKADLAIIDAHYTQAEYEKYKGWGHSCYEVLPELAMESGVKKLVLCHHAPERTDKALDRMLLELRFKYGLDKIKFEIAKERAFYVF